MMWNYRILIHGHSSREDTFLLHEVYYNEAGEPDSWTANPVEFGGDSPDDIRSALRLALSDATKLPPLRVVGGLLIEEP